MMELFQVLKGANWNRINDSVINDKYLTSKFSQSVPECEFIS